MSKDRAKRATREDMIERTKAKLDKLLAQQAGEHQEDIESESFQIKAIRKGLKRRGTLLHRAEIVLNGKAPTATSPAGETVFDQITRLERRLVDKIETRDNAVQAIARLPFDIQDLQDIVDNYENAEDPSTVDVSWPQLSVKVDSDPTETEIEVEAAMTDAERDAEVVTITPDDVGTLNEDLQDVADSYENPSN